MSKLTGGTVVPAYGRDYKKAADAVADFQAGKDFELRTFDGSGYVNKDDFAPGATVNIRYHRHTKVTIHKV